jgi:hypothetical protein
MKVTEAKFTRRYNVGQYEHEEFTVTAMLDDKDDVVETLTILKTDVEAAHKGEGSSSLSDERGQDKDETNEETNSGKAGKKSSKSATMTRGKGSKATTTETESETQDETSDEDDGEDQEDGDDGEETIDDEEGNEEEEKKSSKKATQSPGKKSLKKKGSPYSRSNETHKSLLAKEFRKHFPDWKENAKREAKAKKFSRDMDGKDFLDGEGEIVPEFVKALKAALK